MEPKSICINCGDEWYTEHYKNGYCHTCQQNGTMDNEMRKEKMKIRMRVVVFLTFIAIIAMLLVGCDIERNGEEYQLSGGEVTLVDVNGDTVVIYLGQHSTVYRKK